MDEHAHSQKEDSFCHSMGLQSTIRTPLKLSFSLSCSLSPSQYNSPSTIGLWKRVFKSLLNPSGKSNPQYPYPSNCERVFIVLVLPEAMSLTEAEKRHKQHQTFDQQTRKVRQECISTFLISFRKMDLRYGWPPGPFHIYSVSPSPPPTLKHTDVDAGRRKSNKPGNQVVSRTSQLCGEGFLAELGWLCRVSSV